MTTMSSKEIMDKLSSASRKELDQFCEYYELAPWEKSILARAIVMGDTRDSEEDAYYILNALTFTYRKVKKVKSNQE